jgi:hypothetical protein
MPFYCVTVHGTGINVPDVSGDEPPAVGFYSVMRLSADNTENAKRIAIENVRQRWAAQGLPQRNVGREPALEVEEVERASLFRWLRSRGGGFIFYPEEDDE